MATDIAIMPAPEASAARPWAMPPKLTVSAQTRRLLMELLEADDAEAEASPVVDFMAYRARKRQG